MASFSCSFRKLISALETEGLLASEGAKKTFDPNVDSILSDSRKVRNGSIFVAVSGALAGKSLDGHQFVEDAFERGAVAVFGERKLKTKRPYFVVKDARKALSCLSATFYDHPSEELLVLGVTGTSGKTTTSFLLESILESAGLNPGLIGSVCIRFGDEVREASHTTPDATELQALLHEMKGAGCGAVVIEVSSHALAQSRVADVLFDGMLFTNLSREHLDYHSSMEEYFQAKRILFTDLALKAISRDKTPVAAINSGDPFGRRLLDEIGKNQGTAFQAVGFDPLPEGTNESGGAIEGLIAGVPVKSHLVGEFNRSNLSGAIALALKLGFSKELIAQGIYQLRNVPGRMERVGPDVSDLQVLVDYAHKPDALEKALRAIRVSAGQSKIIAVVGCGGDRDRTKRPVMGRLAAELADRVYLTSDNPRTEFPEAILSEIAGGIPDELLEKKCHIEPDRRTAIQVAILKAKPGEWILIAGKGHETYQILADPKAPGGVKKIHFDDREVALEALMRRKSQ